MEYEFLTFAYNSVDTILEIGHFYFRNWGKPTQLKIHSKKTSRENPTDRPIRVNNKFLS